MIPPDKYVIVDKLGRYLTEVLSTPDDSWSFEPQKAILWEEAEMLILLADIKGGRVISTNAVNHYNIMLSGNYVARSWWKNPELYL